MDTCVCSFLCRTKEELVNRVHRSCLIEIGDKSKDKIDINKCRTLYIKDRETMYDKDTKVPMSNWFWISLTKEMNRISNEITNNTIKNWNKNFKW